jgi:hypothetical protein
MSCFEIVVAPYILSYWDTNLNTTSVITATLKKLLKTKVVQVEDSYCITGYTAYYLGNTLHREDGPAIEYTNKRKEWYILGQFHREDGPAVEDAWGNKWWFWRNKLHREGGPAREYSNGDKEWWIHGKRIFKS